MDSAYGAENQAFYEDEEEYSGLEDHEASTSEEKIVERHGKEDREDANVLTCDNTAKMKGETWDDAEQEKGVETREKIEHNYEWQTGEEKRNSGTKGRAQEMDQRTSRN